MPQSAIQHHSLSPLKSWWRRFLHSLGFRAFPLAELKSKYETEHSRYIEVDGTRLHYRIEGEGPILLLLHGVNSHLQTWDGWVERLKPHYQIVRLDLPGFGLTGPFARGEYTPEFAVQFFERVRQELGLEKFHLVGNSLGGFISWYYAAHYPQHVDKLILIDPLSYPFKTPWIMRFVSLPLIGEITRFYSPRYIVRQNTMQVYGDKSLVTDVLVDRYYELLLRDGNRSAMVDFFRAGGAHFGLTRNGNHHQHIPKIAAPTLLMWGEQDNWIPVALLERWKQDLPSALIKTYAGAGHVPMEEIPEATAADAHAFLSGA
jgi:pimeloyl-ACP methyl ester carboxylesterase